MAFGPDISIGQAIPQGVASDPVPIVTGPHGLTGRVQVVREPDLVKPDYDEDGNEVYRQEPAPGVTIPSPCLQLLNSFGRGQCPGAQCPGVQPDGGCLCEIVRAANAQGVDWSFKVDVDEFLNQTWIYDGPRLV